MGIREWGMAADALGWESISQRIIAANAVAAEKTGAKAQPADGSGIGLQPARKPGLRPNRLDTNNLYPSTSAPRHARVNGKLPAPRYPLIANC